MKVNVRDDFASALAIVAVGTGLGFASGRTQAVFCAQTVRASWLGAVVAGLAFGLLMAMIAHLKRRTGAERFPGVYRRLLGCHAGELIGALYGIALIVAGALLLASAAKVGALALPWRNAGAIGALAALLIALLVAGLGEGALKVVGGGYVLLLLLLEAALWLLAKAPDASRLRFAVDLRLRDSVTGAAILGLLSACMSTALSAGVAVRLAGGRTSPGGLGLFCGLLFTLVNLAGSAALLNQREELLSLRTPFVALAAGWGAAGFYICAGMIFLGASVALAGIALSLLRRGGGRNVC